MARKQVSDSFPARRFYLRKMSVLPGLRSFQSQMQLPKEIETDWLPPACPFSLQASF